MKFATFSSARYHQGNLLFGIYVGCAIGILLYSNARLVLKRADLIKSQEIINDFQNLRLQENDPSIDSLEIPNLEDIHFHDDDRREADRLYTDVRVICLVITEPTSPEIMIKAVQATWAKHCSHFVLFGHKSNSTLEVVGLNSSASGSRDFVNKAIVYVHDHHLYDGDWFVLAQIETYFAMENLRYFLSREDPLSPIFFGHRMKNGNSTTSPLFFAPSAGIVVSKAVIQKYRDFIEKPSLSNSACRGPSHFDGVGFAACLKTLGVVFGNSVDLLGRTRFNCFSYTKLLKKNLPKWYVKMNNETSADGELSDYSISFGSLTPKEIFGLEYYLYHLRPFGIKEVMQELNT